MDDRYEHIPLTDPGLPELIEIEPVHGCNLRCIMCHVSYERLSKMALDPRLIGRLKGLEDRWVKLGSKYEPLVHRRFPELIARIGELGLKVDLTTNGILLNDANTAALRSSRLENLTISFDGATKSTYERIRRGAKFEVAMERILRFREACRGDRTYFAVNNTVLRSTVDEVLPVVEFWERADFDHVGFIAMVMRQENELLQAERLDPDLDRYRARLDEAVEHLIEKRLRITMSSSEMQHLPARARHPERFNGSCVSSENPASRTPFNPISYFQNGYFPDVPVACRSPYKFARINFNGDVELCYQFYIGNLHEKPFVDIWYGKEAERARAAIARESTLCHLCDYYRFCIRAGEVDTDDPLSRAHAPLRLPAGHPYPHHIGFYQGFRIVGWINDYYAVPLTAGRVDVRLVEDSMRPPFPKAGSVEELKVLLRNLELGSRLRAQAAWAPRTLGDLRGQVGWVRRKMKGRWGEFVSGKMGLS